MLYVINDVILVIFSGVLTYYLAKGNRNKTIVLSVFLYCCAPVIKFQERGINPAYLVTGILCVWIFNLYIKKNIKWTWKLILFFVINVLSICVVFLAWILTGKYVMSQLIHFVGMGQIVIGIIALCIICPEYEAFCDNFSVGIKGAIVWNFVMVILQMFVPKVGFSITKLFYTYAGHSSPLLVMEEEGRFLRAFGASYSPTETGGFALLVIALLIARIYKKGTWKKEMPFLFMILFVGIFAFSKAVIIGVFIVFAFSCAIFFLLKKKLQWERMFAVLIFIVVTFLIVGGIGNKIGLSGQVDYYFGKLLNPISSLETRYGVTNGNTDGLNMQNGNLDKTIEVIKGNWLFGVGPAPISGEFIGDSQFIVSLHDGGAVNVFLHLALYITLFIFGWKSKNDVECIFICVFAIECIFIPVFFCSYSIPFVSFCLHKREAIMSR